MLPWMKAILDDFLAIFSPFVTIVEHIHLASSLKTEPWLSKLSPRLHFGLF